MILENELCGESNFHVVGKTKFANIRFYKSANVCFYNNSDWNHHARTLGFVIEYIQKQTHETKM